MLKKMCGVFLVAMLICSIGAVSVWASEISPDAEAAPGAEASGNGAEVLDGLVVGDDGATYYYENGVRQADRWYEKDGKKYYFGTNGRMVTGMKKIDGKRYYFGADGQMATGMTKIKDKQYYFKSNGQMATGMTKIKGKYYYFKSNGRMVTGMKKIKGKYYYFKANGQRKTGWLHMDNGKTYYFDKKTGVRVTGKQTISHYIRYFDEKGVLYRTIDKKKKMVALTYDDGPSKDTPTILRVLKANNSVATFFVVGNRVSSYKSAVKKAYEQGCEIANHTYSHPILTRMSSAGIKSQISKTNKAVKRITGHSPKLLRTPGGAVNSTVRSAAGMPIIYWRIDTLDWKTRSASKTTSAVLNHVKDGDIVLMHDLHHSTAIASKTIIPRLVKKGYQLVTVSELAECRGGMKKGKVYYSFRK
ncbi:MAG TPA: hypothetical protein DF613_03350 [Lachnospiraceae bacterium]|nr:hypothetical protein [Lachnospiraceae bacterium]